MKRSKVDTGTNLHRFKGCLEILARTTVAALTGEFRVLMAVSFGRRTFAGEGLLEGIMAAFAYTQDEPRRIPLSGHEQNEEATEKEGKWVA